MGSNSKKSTSSSSIFIGIWNINGKDLNKGDNRIWLTDNGVSECDIVVLGFQECASCRRGGSVPSPLVDFGMKQNDGLSRRDFFCRSSVSNTKNDEPKTEPETEPEPELEENCEFVLSSVLPDHKLLADIAMGEPPSSKQQQQQQQFKKVKDDSVKWHGFIRMIVYVKREHLSYLSSNCTPILCPTGQKPTLHPTLPNYPFKSSPDKGAICLAIPSLNLLLCNVHLHGTNKYDTPESTFDTIRKQQLLSISNICQTTLGKHNFSEYQKIVFGDFNFRCEIHPTEKEKGGKDFQTVNDILLAKNDPQILDLFVKHDRLHLYLQQCNQHTCLDDKDIKQQPLQQQQQQQTQSSTKQQLSPPPDRQVPSILQNCIDLFFHKCFSPPNNQIILPTFSFQIEDEKTKHRRRPRTYSDKRTPSWTDRILIETDILEKGLLESNKNCNLIKGKGKIISIGTCLDVVSSDHAPVYCVIKFQPNLDDDD